MRFILCGGVFLLASSACFGQSLSSTDIDRGLSQPGARIPYDGMPFTQRYNYGYGGVLYLNGNGSNLWLLDYWDRVERANKFGYKEPPYPFPQRVIREAPVPGAPGAPEVQEEPVVPEKTKVGLGFGLGGWFRRR